MRTLFIIVFLGLFWKNSTSQTVLYAWSFNTPKWISSNPSSSTLGYQENYGHVSTSDSYRGKWNVYNNSQITTYTSPSYNFSYSDEIEISMELDINLHDRTGKNKDGIHYDWLYFQYSLDNGLTWINPITENTRKNGNDTNLTHLGLLKNDNHGFTGNMGELSLSYKVLPSDQMKFRYIFVSNSNKNAYDYNLNISYADIIDFNVISVSTLPVEILCLSGIRKQELTELSWITQYEANDSLIEIERSGDGILFNKIGETKFINNSEKEVVYTYLDDVNKNNEIYYRLRIIDKYNNFKHSKVLIIK